MSHIKTRKYKPKNKLSERGSIIFEGFSGEGLEFLARLPSLDKEQFAANKADWNQFVLQPTKNFVEDIGGILRAELSPTISAVARVNGSISPIHRDLRFSQDKTMLYKDFLLLNFWDGADKKTAPTLRIRLSATGIGFATGMTFSDAGLTKWREAIDQSSSGEPFDTMVTTLLQNPPASLAPPELKKVPAGFDPDHPRSSLLKHKTFQLRWQKPVPETIYSPEFVDWCAAELSSVKSIHLWFKEHTT